MMIVIHAPCGCQPCMRPRPSFIFSSCLGLPIDLDARLPTVMVGEGRPSTSSSAVRLDQRRFTHGRRKTWMLGTDPRIRSGDEHDEKSGTQSAAGSALSA